MILKKTTSFSLLVPLFLLFFLLFFILFFLGSLSSSLAYETPFAWVVGKHSSLKTFQKVSTIQLRERIPLSIENLFGSVWLESWALDKVQVEVRVRNHFLGSNPFQWEIKFEKGKIWIQTFFKKGTFLKKKQAFSKKRHAQIDLRIRAPAYLSIESVLKKGKFFVQNWQAPLWVQIQEGGFFGKKLQLSKLTFLAQKGTFDLNQSQIAHLNAFIQNGTIHVQTCELGRGFLETEKGEQTYHHLEGDLWVLSQEGSFKLSHLRGNMRFQWKRGDVQIDHVVGSVFGTTEKASVVLKKMDCNSRFAVPLWIETQSGWIRWIAPKLLEAKLWMKSPQGGIYTDFFSELHPFSIDKKDLHCSFHQCQGTLKEGTNQVRFWSQSGYIEVLKEKRNF